MKKILLIMVIIVAIGGTWLFIQKHRDKSNQKSKTNQTSSFDKSAHSTSDSASIWVIVNKQRPLPNTYVPASLRAPSIALRESNGSPEMELRDDAAAAVESLAATAKKDGINLMVVSGYRSFAEQQTVYQGYVKQDGQAKADTYSARPGHSEHQTGLAIDFGTTDRKCELEACFGDTAAGKWLVAHAPEYGFVLRYANGTQNVVGYAYEPWHFRYVGKDLAAEAQQTGKTLEEIFSLPPAPDYN